MEGELWRGIVCWEGLGVFLNEELRMKNYELRMMNEINNVELGLAVIF